MSRLGAASIFIELKDGIITVTHGTDKVTLKEFEANQHSWKKIWQGIELAEINAKASPDHE